MEFFSLCHTLSTSISLPIFLSAKLFIYQSIYLPNFLSVNLSAKLSLCQSICIYTCLYTCFTRCICFIYSNWIFSANVFIYEYLINKMIFLYDMNLRSSNLEEIHLIVGCALRLNLQRATSRKRK